MTGGRRLATLFPFFPLHGGLGLYLSIFFSGGGRTSVKGNEVHAFFYKEPVYKEPTCRRPKYLKNLYY